MKVSAECMHCLVTRQAENIKKYPDEEKKAEYLGKVLGIIADNAAEYKESLAAAKAYVGLAKADPTKANELRGYIKHQENKIAGMSEEERRAYLKEPPKKNWMK